MPSMIELIGYVFGVLWPLWPLIFLRAILNAFGKKARRSTGRDLLVIWGLLALCRFAAAIFLPSVQSFLIPEPWNTILFFAVGMVLIGTNVARIWLPRARWSNKNQTITRSADLLSLSPAEFEEMVAQVYRAKGHRARRTGAVGDHGVDIVVQAKNGEKWIVQCKRWRGTVGEAVVREFYGTMLHEKADKGAIITTGFFTPHAREWVKGKPIFLYDREEFFRIWRQVQKAIPEVSPDAEFSSDVAEATSPSEPPRCPRCGVPMVLRVARRGSQPGRLFYGCPNYPLCREIVNIPTRYEQ